MAWAASPCANALLGATSYSGFDLVAVSAHETGHALGLGHTSATAAVLATNYGSFAATRFPRLGGATLSADDVAGIQANYGSGTKRIESLFKPGDANRDGQVYVSNLQVLALNWGKDGFGFSGGNFDYVGSVGDSDLSMIRNDWGFGVTGGPSTSFDEAAALMGLPIPEPSSPSWTGLVAAAGVLARRKRCPVALHASTELPC